MLAKLRSGWVLLQAGRRVADPVKWKRRQIEVTAVASVIWAATKLLESFGVVLPMDQETVDGLAFSTITVVNFVLTLATTNKPVLESVGR
jgi:hypothetical protein